MNNYDHESLELQKKEEGEQLQVTQADALKVGQTFLYRNQSRWKVTEIPSHQPDPNCIVIKTVGKKFGAPKTFTLGRYYQVEIEK